MLRRLVVAQAEPMCFKIETWHFYLVHLGTNTHPLSIKCVNVKYRNRAAIKLHSGTTGIYAPPQTLDFCPGVPLVRRSGHSKACSRVLEEKMRLQREE